MKTKSCVCIFLLVVAAVAPAQTNTLTTLLQQGLFEEQANRNLDAAIADYQSVAMKFDKDRQIAATAVFRLGECYRMQGKTNEAALEYQRILREFSDQNALATLSRQDLTGLGAAVSETTPSENSDAKLWNSLKNLGPSELEKVLPTLVPDPTLTSLVEQRDEAETKLAHVHNDYGTNHPLFVATKAALDTCNHRIAGRIDGIMRALKIRAEFSQTAVATAAPTDDEEQEIRRIQEMTQNSPDLINVPGNGGSLPPLIQAAASDHLRVARYLLDHQAKLDVRCDQGETPLTAAAGNGHKAMVELLLSRGADVNAKGGNGFTALRQAAWHGFQAVAEVLLANKADVNAQDYSGNTPLHLAAMNRHARIVQMLLEAGANPNLEDNDGRTPLSFAAQSGSPETVRILLAAKADPNEGTLDAPLLGAIDKQDAASAELLLRNGANPNGGGRIDWHNNSSFSPLFLAVIENQLPIVQLLLKFKADPNGSQTVGNPLLFSALDKTNILEALLAAGANPNVEDNNGKTPLSLAAQRGSPETVRILLAAKADPNGGKLDAPLLGAIHKQDAASAELLLRNGANPNAKGKFDANGRQPSPLWLAVSENQPSMVQLLLKFKTDPNGSQTDGNPLLFSALDKTNILEALLDAGAKVDARQQTGKYANWRPLEAAVEWNNAPAVEILLRHGADPNARDSRGDTALHWAATRLADRKFFELLLDYKADPNLRNNDGTTPLDRVKNADNKTAAGEIADLLRQHGALDHLPHWDRIDVSRPSANFSFTVFRKGTNDWNRFTLLETILNYYDLSQVTKRFYPGGGAWTWESATFVTPFPDLARVIIARPSHGSTNQTRVAVSLLNALNGIDCSKDMPLDFGDVVEIPERDHSLGDSPVGLTDSQSDTIVNYLKGNVQLVVRDQKMELPLYPAGGQSSIGFVLNKPEARKLLLSSSDLSRVKVIRRDPKTGTRHEWIVDCSPPPPPDGPPMHYLPGLLSRTEPPPPPGSDLWLRDGDVIEVPEKP